VAAVEEAGLVAPPASASQSSRNAFWPFRAAGAGRGGLGLS
jgi:hypothetical protein